MDKTDIKDVAEIREEASGDECGSSPAEEVPIEKITEIRTVTSGTEFGNSPVEAVPDEEFEFSEVSKGVDAACGTCQPLYNFKCLPIQITGAWKEFEEISSSNFTKGCKWAPDGTCILTNSDDNYLRLFNMPIQMWENSFSWSDMKEMTAVLNVQESELVYDYCWYPLMSSLDPVSCCFVSTTRDNPVHMWDAFNGELRCSYRAYNHVDEIVAAHCVAFDLQGRRLFCGFSKMIRVFDVSVPGRDCQERLTNSKKQGQPGIISCIAFSPTDEDIYAAGSYSKSIGIYGEPKGELIYLLTGQQGGVTHLCFSPDGSRIYSGGRKDQEILCWDIRNPGQVLFSMRRIVTTNQRIYFSLSKCGQYLVSGNQNGVVTVWDILSPPKHILSEKEPILEPIHFFQAHNDCVNGVSFHPYCPLLITSSGQRKFAEPLDSDGENDNEMFTDKYIVRDNSLRLWWLGDNSSFHVHD